MAEDATSKRLMVALKKALAGRYEVVRFVNNGATGQVFEVKELSLGHRRALKVLRPGLPLIDEGEIQRSFSDYFAKEVERLASITHENVVQIYEKGVLKKFTVEPKDAPCDLPFYVMEYLDADDVDKFLIKNLGQLTSRNVLDLLVQLGAGLRAIHEAGVVHGDVKPGNISISGSVERGLRLKLTDFGFAKSLVREEMQSTLWCEDRGYLHPELRHKLLKQKIAQPDDPHRSIIRVTDEELRLRAVVWELHAIGRTIAELVNISETILDERDARFLRIACDRLQDGREQGPWDSPPRSDAYVKVSTVSSDLAKLSRSHGLGGDAPEFHRRYRQTVRVPLCDRIPWTNRLKGIVDHPLFQRLGRVSQLGVVNLGFRSGTHSRFEHSLGVMWHGMQYIRALWHSASGSYFRQAVQQKDCEAFLIAALLHDLGQYPFAHAFEESDIQRRAVYSHTELTRRMLRAVSPEEVIGSENLLPLFDKKPLGQIEQLLRDQDGKLLQERIAEVGRASWGADLDDVLFLLTDRPEEKKPKSFALEILRRVINGPIDADKMDYLRRDALHLGLPLGLDFPRLLQVLTVVETGSVGAYDLAVHEDGVGIAQDLHYARYKMFVEVYWDKVARAAERMLRHAVDGLRQALGEDHFAQCFFVAVLTSSDFELLTRLQQVAEEESESTHDAHIRGRLIGCAELLRSVNLRHLHYEALEIDSDRYWNLHERLSNFWGWAISDVTANRQFTQFSDRLLEGLRAGGKKSLQAHQVLLDIPDPRTDSPEKYAVLVRARNGDVKAIADRSPMWKDYAQLFRKHGRRIRVFADRSVLPLEEKALIDSIDEALKGVAEQSFFSAPPRPQDAQAQQRRA